MVVEYRVCSDTTIYTVKKRRQALVIYCYSKACEAITLRFPIFVYHLTMVPSLLANPTTIPRTAVNTPLTAATTPEPLLACLLKVLQRNLLFAIAVGDELPKE